jgi:hypothetical protein
MHFGSKQLNSSKKMECLSYIVIDLMQGRKVNELALCHSPLGNWSHSYKAKLLFFTQLENSCQEKKWEKMGGKKRGRVNFKNFFPIAIDIRLQVRSGDGGEKLGCKGQEYPRPGGHSNIFAGVSSSNISSAATRYGRIIKNLHPFYPYTG